ncbi:GntR family transcriptional regulator [Streptomyces sp. CNQ085]|uniref:GntR family transcriptional regulator n=1 Tax=Streptomyces sp. CNQ085 TaxID=2886944 RepID=UPI001F508687|nr:GntR family transcriptional regulator [Streptomyces sp. CNQ085]MCI0386407.1 GntR family transcriptional regulator [Streptomyces sp. CNQ085]
MRAADVIRRRITNGTCPPRTRVPSVIQLRAEFGVAQATAQKALTRLRAESRHVHRAGTRQLRGRARGIGP